MKSRWGWCRMVLAGGLILAAGSGDWRAVRAGDTNPPARPAPVSRTNMQLSIVKTEAEWRKELTPEQFRVLRQKGTERAFTGAFWNHHEKGEYRCAGCGMALFASEAKFDSGCGWPSFSTPAATNAVAEAADRSHGLERTEVLCSKCGGHLGHVFDDGPKPTGLRYCINSAALKFEKKKDAK